MHDGDSVLARSGLDRQLGFALREASTAVWGHVRRALEPLGLRPQGFATLLIISTNPGCKQQDIADALGIQRPNLVALIDGLEAQGLVVRTVNSGDRRSYALTLTGAGHDLLTQAQAADRALDGRIVHALDGVDIDALMAALARLARL